MKKLWILTVLVGMMAVTGAQANTISAFQTTGRSYGDGGEFTAKITGSSETFQTFCLEVFNTFNPGADYAFTVGQTTHNNPAGASPLKLGTAYLVNLWANGSLPGYTDNSKTPSEHAGELQAALWYYQGQGYNPASDFTQFGLPMSSGSFDHTKNQYVQLIDNLPAPFNPFAASDGAYGVFVYQLENGQDWVGVPDGGLTAMLLGMSMLGLGWVRRMVK